MDSNSSVQSPYTIQETQREKIADVFVRLSLFTQMRV